MTTYVNFEKCHFFKSYLDNVIFFTDPFFYGFNILTNRDLIFQYLLKIKEGCHKYIKSLKTFPTYNIIINTYSHYYKILKRV